MVSARPILALFGQPGGGKSTLAKKVYAFLYGRNIKLGGVTSPENFDTAMSKYPLLILDDVQDAERWLKDRFAQAAGDLDVPVRELYTTNTMAVKPKRAMLGVTAHDPKFVRADVADRLLILTFTRVATGFQSETDMLGRIISRRNILWGHIINDVQRILATPRPPITHSALRIGDFVTVGRWFAKALDYERDFEDAVNAIQSGQRTQILGEEALLADTLLKYVRMSKTSNNFKPIGLLWIELDALGGDDFKRMYKNAQNLSKRIWILQDALKAIVDIDYQDGKVGREWRISEKSS